MILSLKNDEKSTQNRRQNGSKTRVEKTNKKHLDFETCLGMGTGTKGWNPIGRMVKKTEFPPFGTGAVKRKRSQTGRMAKKTDISADGTRTDKRIGNPIGRKA